jgi:hypothetical protein
LSVAHGPPRAMSSRLELAPMSPVWIFCLTIVSISVTAPKSRSLRTHSGCDLQCGASAVLPRGLATRAGAASGIIPFGTTAEAWGAVTGLGQDRAGNARWLF